MNYRAVYDQLIDNRRKNTLQYIKGKTPGIERHHILPKCVGGTDVYDNIINLTAREHFIAHVLLSKIYPRNIELLFVVNKFMGGSKRARTRRAFHVSSRIYNIIKKQVHYFLTHSKWIHSMSGKRKRIWNDEQIPEGWLPGMGKASALFMKRMNDRSRRKKPVEWNGKIYTIKELSQISGIKPSTILSRLHNGWPVDKIMQVQTRHGYDEYDIALIQKMFEFWKTHTLTETRKKFINQWRRSDSFTLPQLQQMFKRYCPEYEKLRKTHSRLFVQLYNGKTLADWEKISGIDATLLKARLNAGQTIEQAISVKPNKPGWNFTDSDEVKKHKKKLAAEMFEIFVQAGRGSGGLNAVNEKLGKNIGFDSLCRWFKRQGVWKDAEPLKYEYKGKLYTLDELSKLTNIAKHTLWHRFVRCGYYGKIPIEELLSPVFKKHYGLKTK